MANESTESALAKRSGTLALVLAMIALGIAIFSMISASKAQRAADNANQSANSLQNAVQEVIKMSGDKASPGGGVGPNTFSQPATGTTGNTMPNGSGQ